MGGPTQRPVGQWRTGLTQCQGRLLHGRKERDAVRTFRYELCCSATTNAKVLAGSVAIRHDDNYMTVVFSAYKNIEPKVP